MKISKEFKVGLLALIAGVLMYFGVNFLRGSDFLSSTNTYYAIYDDIDGLTVSNQVLVNGLTVGRVSDIRILQDQGNKLLVAIDVEDEIMLGDSTVALLIDSDLLGSKAISLEIGEVTTPKKHKDMLIGKVDVGFTEAIKQTALPVIDNMDSVFININNLLANLNRNNEAINATFANLNQTSDDLKKAAAESRQKLANIMDNVNQLTSAFSDAETGLEPFLIKINNLADSLNDMPLKQTVDGAYMAMNNLKEITDKINEGGGSLGKLMNNDSLYQNLNNSAESLDRLLIDLRENPNRYIHFSVFGRKDKGGDAEAKELK